MIVSKSKPITPGAAIFYGGVIAGILDAADDVVAYHFAAGFSPIQVLQSIASGFYGAAAFQKGISGALVGLLAHFFIAFAVAAIYVGATRFLPMLSTEAVIWGTILRHCGIHCYELYRTTAHSGHEITLVFAPLAERVLAHAFFVGLPIALAARRITSQSSFSTQAAHYRARAFRRNS